MKQWNSFSGLWVTSLIAVALTAPFAAAQNYALQLDPGSGVDFPHHAIMNTGDTATIEAWLRGDPNVVTDNFSPFTRYEPMVEHKDVYVLADGSIEYKYAGSPWEQAPWYGGAPNAPAGSFPIDDDWHHAAFVRHADGSWQVFVDGAERLAMGPGTGLGGGCWLTCAVINGATPTKVYSNSAGWYIDEMRVSDSDRYSVAFTPTRGWTSDASTVMLLGFDEGQGNVVADDGPGGQVGTISGAFDWALVASQSDVSGLYRFEEGNPGSSATAPGSILDSSPVGAHGDPYGSPRYSADVAGATIGCAFGAVSLEFDGVDDWVQVHSAFVLNGPATDATLEFWMKAQVQGHRAVFWTNDPLFGDSNRFHLFTGTGTELGLDYRGPDGTLHTLLAGDNTFSFPADTWTHVAVTRVVDSASQHTYRFYRNGVLVHTAVDANPSLPQGQTWTIAGRPPPHQRFVGTLDEIRMTKSALSPDEFLSALPPSTYCLAKTNSLGCTPTIGSTGLPSLNGADDFYITAAHVISGKVGGLVWGTEAASLPFAGGTLCVKPPVVRMKNTVSSGPTPSDCSGTFSYHWSHGYSAAHLIGAGTTIHAQLWYRDPGFAEPDNVGLTDALRFTICP